jgi:hypothetical protein
MTKDGYTPHNCLFEHRDYIFREYNGLPLDF